MPRTIRCKRTAYTRANEGTLNTPAQSVVKGLTDHAALFPAHPVALPAFASLITAYSLAYSAYKSGGLAQKPAYQRAKAALLHAMNLTATYVDGVAKGDANIIMHAGYVPTKGTVSATPPPAEPTGLKAWRGSTGELFFECDHSNIRDLFGAILTEGAPLPSGISINSSRQIIVSDTGRSIPSATPKDGGQPEPPSLTTPFAALASANITMFALDTNKGRRKHFLGLIPGRFYYCTFFIINARGVSQLCPPVSIQCW